MIEKYVWPIIHAAIIAITVVYNCADYVVSYVSTRFKLD